MSQGAGIGNLLLLLLPILLLVWLFVTQRRRQREVQQLQADLSVGDDVCTTSGLFGTITAIEDGVLLLEIAPGVVVRYDRRAVGLKTTPKPVAGSTDDGSATGPAASGE